MERADRVGAKRQHIRRAQCLTVRFAPVQKHGEMVALLQSSGNEPNERNEPKDINDFNDPNKTDQVNQIDQINQMNQKGQIEDTDQSDRVEEARGPLGRSSP